MFGDRDAAFTIEKETDLFDRVLSDDDKLVLFIFAIVESADHDANSDVSRIRQSQGTSERFKKDIQSDVDLPAVER